MIKHYECGNIFAINTENTSLILKPDSDNILRTLYYGKLLSNPEEAFILNPSVDKYISSGEKRPLRPEFPVRQKAYYCEPCIYAVFSDGARDLRLEYDSFNISDFSGTWGCEYKKAYNKSMSGDFFSRQHKRYCRSS